MSLSTIFCQYPDFQKWVQNKKLNTQHLSILTEFEDISVLKPLIQWIEQHQPSHSQGEQILELGGELLLMDKTIEPILLKEHQASSLIESLKKHRTPCVFLRDKNKSELLKNMDWPQSIKSKWVRQNDKGALSIHFHSFSLRDFKQKIQKLNSIYKQLNEGSQKLWKN